MLYGQCEAISSSREYAREPDDEVKKVVKAFAESRRSKRGEEDQQEERGESGRG